MIAALTSIANVEHSSRSLLSKCTCLKTLAVSNPTSPYQKLRLFLNEVKMSGHVDRRDKYPTSELRETVPLQGRYFFRDKNTNGYFLAAPKDVSSSSNSWVAISNQQSCQSTSGTIKPCKSRLSQTMKRSRYSHLIDRARTKE